MIGHGLGQSTVSGLGVAEGLCGGTSFCDPDQEVIGVTTNRRPSTLADLVDHLCRLRAPLSQVPADEHFIERSRSLEVRYNLEKSYQIAMWIRDECDPPGKAMWTHGHVRKDK
jgi:hypothetical protein